MRKTIRIPLIQAIKIIPLLLFCNSSYAFNMTINWTEWSNGAYVDYFKVYWGTSSGNYANASGNISSNQTSYTIPNLIDGQVYYFAVKAFDSLGNSSFYSNETSSNGTLNVAITSPGNNFVVNAEDDYTSITITGTGTANANIEIFEGSSSSPIAVTSIGNDGRWSIDLDFTNITQGSVTITAVQNNTSNSIITGNYDRVPPQAPDILTIE